MDLATHNDVVRIFRGIQDHAVVEVLAMGATVDELEAALLLLQGDDDALIKMKRQKGNRLNRLLGILENSEILLRDELET